MGRHEDSLADIRETLALEPRHFGALSGRGLVYAALERWRPALESFEKALEVNPHMTGARTNSNWRSLLTPALLRYFQLI